MLEAKLLEMNFSDSQHQENSEFGSAKESDLVSKTNGKDKGGSGHKEAACKQSVGEENRPNQPLERPQPSLLEMANESVQSGRQRSQDPHDMARNITKKVRIDMEE